MENLKKTVKEINEKYSYFTPDRFASVLRITGKFSEAQIKEYSKLIGRGALYFIENAPNEVIEAVMNYNVDFAYKTIRFENDGYTSKYFVKIICQNIESNEFVNYEIDLCTYDGNKTLISLHENKDLKIIATCRMCDDITKRNVGYVKIYEGDIISTQGANYSGGKSQLIMAFLDGRFINGDPIYRELLWTDKYGYLAPNKECKPNLDTTVLFINESSFNFKEGRYNYHKITLEETFSVIGNINSHYNLLKP